MHFGLPLGDLGYDKIANVVFVGQNSRLILNTDKTLSDQTYRLWPANSGFHAGLLAATFPVDCLIVDFSIGRAEAMLVCAAARRRDEHLILIALLPDDGSIDRFSDGCFTAAFVMPIDVAELAKDIRELVGAKKELL